MRQSIYSQLNPNQYKTKNQDDYQGFWHGQEVSFPRDFRGYRFTDEECQALCNGNRVEVHNIQGKHGVYAVQGILARSAFGTMKFDVLDTVPNNPDWKFGMELYDLTGEMAKIKALQKPKKEDKEYVEVDLNSDDDLEGILFEEPQQEVFMRKQKEELSLKMAWEASHAALQDTGQYNPDEDYEDEDDEEYEEEEMVDQDEAYAAYQEALERGENADGLDELVNTGVYDDFIDDPTQMMSSQIPEEALGNDDFNDSDYDDDDLYEVAEEKMD